MIYKTESKDNKLLTLTFANIKVLIGLFAIIAIILIFLQTSSFQELKENIACEKAIMEIENGDYNGALESINDNTSTRAEAIRKYLLFRKEIAEKPLYDNYNIQLLQDYRDKCSEILNQREVLGDVAKNDLKRYLENADAALRILKEYSEIHELVGELYEVTDEFNRLHNYGTEGECPYFTIAEEREKIEQWQSAFADLDIFMKNLGINWDYIICFGTGIPRLQWIKDKVPMFISELAENMDEAENEHDVNSRIRYTTPMYVSVCKPFSSNNEDMAFEDLARVELWNLVVYSLDNPARTKRINFDGMAYAILSNGTVEFVGLNEKRSEVVIPESIEFDGVQYEVSSIANGAFKGISDIKNISLPDTIKRIGANSFADTKNCETITIVAMPECVALNAFENTTASVVCSYLTKQNLLEVFGYGRYTVDDNTITYEADW